MLCHAVPFRAKSTSTLSVPSNSVNGRLTTIRPTFHPRDGSALGWS